MCYLAQHGDGGGVKAARGIKSANQPTLNLGDCPGSVYQQGPQKLERGPGEEEMVMQHEIWICHRWLWGEKGPLWRCQGRWRENVEPSQDQPCPRRESQAGTVR